jgi:hypothetical protein
MPSPEMPADERRAAIRAMFEQAPYETLTVDEATALLDGFLRLREAEAREFSDLEPASLITWAQRVRLDRELLGLAARQLVSIDTDGLEISLALAPAEEFFAAARGRVAGEDEWVGAALRAFVAGRLAQSREYTPAELKFVADWGRVTHDTNALLDAFVGCEGAMIDYDHRGRVAIYPPERL